MPNIFHQSVEDILKAATPEQRLMWNYIFLRWGERVPISQVFYLGASSGSEFLTYSANKLYVAYYMASTNGSVPSASNVALNIYDENNNLSYYLKNNNAYWDATAGAYRTISNNAELRNIYFSRIIFGANYSQFHFIGYRIGI